MGLANEEDRRRVMDHTGRCRFCSEIIEQFQAFQASVASVSADELTLTPAQSDRLYRAACRGQIISLTFLSKNPPQEELSLAADGKPVAPPEIEEIATLVSDASDLVLRLLHDHKTSRDYVQLVAEDPAAIAYTLVQVPSQNQEFVTDKAGRVDLPAESETAWDNVDWQIKMPEAVFDLKPLEYTPDQPEYSRSVELDTEQADRVRVTFEKHADSCSVVVEVLALQGQTDFGALRALVTTDTPGQPAPTPVGQPIVLDLPDHETPITIRLYRDL
ncbi:MAG: hypothetical protein ABIE70_11095 [bacterium]